VTTTTTPPRRLPDGAFDAAAAARPLDWVGMSNIALPLRVAGPDGEAITVAASVDVSVDLKDADARGIHMSRM
jgi:GTP cyclohydrolase I